MGGGEEELFRFRRGGGRTSQIGGGGREVRRRRQVQSTISTFWEEGISVSLLWLMAGGERGREEGKPRRVEVVMEERWAVRLCERASKADFGFLCWNRYCHFVCSHGSHYWFSEKGVNLDYFFEKYSIDTNAHNTYIHSTLYMHVNRTTISISEGQSG